MSKLIDPRSGKPKFYKGPGRRKDKDLAIYDRQISEGRAKVIGSNKHTPSEHQQPDIPSWQPKFDEEANIDKLRKIKKKIARERPKDPARVTRATHRQRKRIDSNGRKSQWTRGQKVIISATATKATVLRQFLVRNKDGTTSWGHVRIRVDTTGIEIICKSNELVKYNANAPLG